MKWAFQQKPSHFYYQHPLADELINENDGEFKKHLDHYKYASRFPEHTEQTYRQQGEVFLQRLENQLQKQDFLLGQQSWLDFAIFPFIRQFSMVDQNWFEQSNYQQLKYWLQFHLDSALFQQIMQKNPVWK